MKRDKRTITAQYMGLKVQIISRMDYCSLVCFKGRAIIVDTADLAFDKAFEQAA